jgi:hypothetical protein
MVLKEQQVRRTDSSIHGVVLSAAEEKDFDLIEFILNKGVQI